MKVPDDIHEQLKGVDAEQLKFESALGRFTLTWSDTEAMIYRVLVRYAGVTDAVARAIFSGTRAKVMTDYIKAIAHNTEMHEDRLADLEFVFAQVTAINSLRDHVTHFGSAELLIWREPSSRVLTNRERVSRIGKAVAKEVGSKTLDDMTFDLQGINNHLNVHWVSKADPFKPWQEHPGEATVWRFKPPQPIIERRAEPGKLVDRKLRIKLPKGTPGAKGG